MKKLVVAGLAAGLVVASLAGAADARTRHAPRQGAPRTASSGSSSLLTTDGLTGGKGGAGGYDGLGDTLTIGGGKRGGGALAGSGLSTGGKRGGGGGDLSGLGGGQGRHSGARHSKGGL